MDDSSFVKKWRIGGVFVSINDFITLGIHQWWQWLFWHSSMAIECQVYLVNFNSIYFLGITEYACRIKQLFPNHSVLGHVSLLYIVSVASVQIRIILIHYCRLHPGRMQSLLSVSSSTKHSMRSMESKREGRIRRVPSENCSTTDAMPSRKVSSMTTRTISIFRTIYSNNLNALAFLTHNFNAFGRAIRRTPISYPIHHYISHNIVRAR